MGQNYSQNLSQTNSSLENGIDEDLVIATTKKKNCYCDDETFTKDTPCVICGTVHNILLGKWDREWECCKKITAICGTPEFVCNTCEEKGWYSTAGTGGGTYHMNDKTGQTKPTNTYITP